MPTQEEFEFAGKIFEGMTNWSQALSNQVIENLEAERDEARRNFVALWNAIDRANNKIDSQRLGWILDDNQWTRDFYNNSKEGN